MIVYNVKRRWFTMKNDAEAYRRAEKLPPSATFKLDIRDRDDLATLLNGLCGSEPTSGLAGTNPSTIITDEVAARNRVTDDVPDYVPLFLVREWQARERRRNGDD